MDESILTAVVGVPAGTFGILNRIFVGEPCFMSYH